MAAINDLLRQITDKALRERLEQEFARLNKNKKFGLVFEEHIPECTPLFDVAIRRGNTVAKKTGRIDDIYSVMKIDDDTAVCLRKTTSEIAEFKINELVAVAQFGEPIFPSLIPIAKVENAPSDSLWHTLIEADNYHALQLLEYLYPKQVDCIYIDPPYNTGARDWKYNNDYVDAADNWRHSKWLAFMERRLRLAKRLLKPNTGVLIVTIDEHEVHHLGMLLEREFPETYRQMVTIVITPGGVTQGRFARVEEYALFCFNQDAYAALSPDDLLSSETAKKTSSQPGWQSLIRRGVSSRRTDREGMFYPIFVDPKTQKILGAGEYLPLGQEPDWDKVAAKEVAWPIRSDGEFGRWRVGPATFNKLHAQGFVKLGSYDEDRRTWTVLYLQQKTISEIEAGTIEIIDRDKTTGVVELGLSAGAVQLKPLKTVWNRSFHHAGTHGSTLLRNIFGESSKFSFPKSLYATRDAIAAIVRDRPNALIVDFFAGSGTTLHAVNLLNAEDGGRRRCILVTNNEVSEAEALTLRRDGLQPGDAEWEKHGICRAVTWPRTVYSILGKRSDGSPLEGEYITHQTVEREESRSFYQLGFVEDAAALTTSAKKQIVALLGKTKLPQSLVKADSKFIVSEKHTASVLFDCAYCDEYIEAIEEQDHITEFYIVAKETTIFNAVKNKVSELLGTVKVSVNLKCPMRDGFATNAEYFKLGFLDKNSVTLGQQFREILPLLWMKSGAIGERPELSGDDIPEMMILPQNGFAILIDETKFAKFADALAGTGKIGTIYFVTNSEEAFREMSAGVKSQRTYQLYRDYIDNFVLGSRRDSI